MPPKRRMQHVIDFFITLLLWSYFVSGSIILFFFFLLPVYFFSANRAIIFQKLNYIYLKYFFVFLQKLIPHAEFVIPEEIKKIRSSIIICNHLSYLDPILLISLSPKQRTIIKSTFLKVPFFGWILKKAGYIPSSPREMSGTAMIENLESIKEHLAGGGNLFVFPEGTRSRDGKLNTFNKGVFSIARYCNAPLTLVFIKGTDKLFRPGTFSFNTRDFNKIELKLLETIKPDYQNKDFSVSALTLQMQKHYTASES